MRLLPLVLFLQLATVAHAGAQAPSGPSLRVDPAAAAAIAGLMPGPPLPGEARAGGAAVFALLQGADDSPDDGPEYIWAGALFGAVVGLFAGLAWGSE